MDKAALKNNEFNRTNNANTDMTPEFILPIEKTIQSPLYGRDNEINFLTRTYKQSGYRGVNIYGRRQVGKTSLLQYFCHVHPAIYYQVSSTSSCKSIFCGLRNAAVAFLRKDHPDLAKLLLELQDEEDIVTLIKGIIALSHKLNITLIIDEFPYLVEAVPDVCTELQAVIDAIKRKPEYNFMLVLCGSNIGMMTDIVAETSPLYNRLKSYIIHPLPFGDCKYWLKQYPPEDAFKIYAITDGIPGYLEDALQFNSFEDYATETFLLKDSPRITPPALFYSNSINYGNAASIMKVIIDGKTELNKILQKCKLSVDTAIFTLNQLIKSGAIYERRPLYSKRMHKNTRYAVADPFIVFWYKFLANTLIGDKRLSNISFEAIDNQIFSAFLGMRFENVCAQYMHSILQDILESGYWEDKIKTHDDRIRDGRHEIDIIVNTKQYLCLAECKFTTELIDQGIIDLLILRGAKIDFPTQGKTRQYYYFSRTGFTENAVTFAGSREDIKLITYKDIYDHYFK